MCLHIYIGRCVATCASARQHVTTAARAYQRRPALQKASADAGVCLVLSHSAQLRGSASARTAVSTALGIGPCRPQARESFEGRLKPSYLRSLC